MKQVDKKGPGKGSDSPPVVRYVAVPEDQQGRRLDNFLLNLVDGVPKSRIYRAIRSGEVRINKGRSSASYRLVTGDTVRVPPFRVGNRVKKQASQGGQQQILDTVIEEHKAYFVLNKPSGWAVHGGSGISLGVIETLRQALPAEHYLELVHRLDRATSGCLVIARKRSFLRELHHQIRENEVDKRYLMLVRGHWDYGRHRCELKLHTNRRRSGERHVEVSDKGKYCHTFFRPVEFYKGSTLLEARLHTGRTHQIRVHCAALGHPVAADERYGDSEYNNEISALGCERLFLHASSIAFEYPQGNPCVYSAPLGEELVAVLDRLNQLRS